LKILDTLDRQQLLVVTGKGGVGKSTMTAVLGQRLAARGRRVLLIEVDPRESLHYMLDVPPSGGELVKVGPRLWLQHINPRQLIDDLVREKLKVSALAKRVISSPIHLHFTEGAPGLKETAVFGRVLRMVEGRVPRGVPVPQTVILDAPASGHGLAWLTAPQLISEVIQSGPVGQLSAQIAAFMNDVDRFGVVAVTTAEEMPVQECLELLEGLATQLDRRPELVIINGLYPPFPKKRAPTDSAGKLWFDRRRVNDRELDRLRTAWSGPTAELPLLAIDPGQPLVGGLARRLEECLEGR
jgi:anion-transporting  ArsA/GET3 family ATPase